MIDHDLALQHIYRSLDILAEHKEHIEQSLYQYKKDLFSINVDIVLYDLTTLRFESTREDLGALRKFGYSKEMRTDCTQVVFGLLTDTDGIPLSFEVHPGNTFEGKTLKGIVDKMKKSFRSDGLFLLQIVDCFLHKTSITFVITKVSLSWV